MGADPRHSQARAFTRNIWVALAWCVGILVVAYVFAIISSRKKVS
ncbi:MAG: hypothetical protein K0R99_2492 [Microbacterium sp.]|jgi:hypothetical protein|nr:hypothetical protein [Microbacterium sp.]MDF2561046.1 hypothetical protein [Microbacterium sp.]